MLNSLISAAACWQTQADVLLLEQFWHAQATTWQVVYVKDSIRMYALKLQMLHQPSSQQR